MSENLVQLEEKVLNAVRVIQDLRAENAQLKQQQEEWQSRYEVLKEDNHRMSRELEESRNAVATVEHFEQKRRIIEEKVGGLLEKLEQIG
jgi:FtsZ-binding cell division protein ZapB